MNDGKLKCVVSSCTEEAVGMIVVNDNNSGVTMFMLPMCDGHGQHAKTKAMNIVLNVDEQPTIEVTDQNRLLNADVVLTYEVFDVH